MKKVLFILMMMLPMVVNAQRVDKPGEPYYIFCELTNYTDDAHISISHITKENYLIDETGKKIKFKSHADALTYMSKRGWEYVEKTEVGKFMLRKLVKSDEQALEGIMVKEDKKK